MQPKTQTNVVLYSKYLVYLQNFAWQYTNIADTRFFAIQNISLSKADTHIKTKVSI